MKNICPQIEERQNNCRNATSLVTVRSSGVDKELCSWQAEPHCSCGSGSLPRAALKHKPRPWARSGFYHPQTSYFNKPPLRFGVDADSLTRRVNKKIRIQLRADRYHTK